MSENIADFTARGVEQLLAVKNKPEIFTAGSIQLVPLARPHLTEQYVAWLNDPVVCRYNSHGEGQYSLVKAEQYLLLVQDSKVTVVFAMIDLQTQCHIGNISLNDISWRHRSGEISILIGEKSFWGRGIGLLAVSRVRDFAFDFLKLHRVWLGMTVDNRPMIRIAEKLGFFHEGILKESFFKGGRFHDITQWASLNARDVK